MELRLTYPVATRRLLLRPLSRADADALVAYRSRPDVCRYVPFEPMDASVIADKLAGPWARTAILTEGTGIILGVEQAQDGVLVGDVNLFFASLEHRAGEIGWIVDPEHGGQGYGTEAAHAILHLAFDELGLHRVTARVDARNGPSLRLAARLGMRQEAHLRENEWFKGEWSDEIDFALLEDEWAAQHPGGQCPRVGRAPNSQGRACSTPTRR